MSRCIIGLRNKIGADDGVGLTVARRLRRTLPDGPGVILLRGERLVELPQLIKDCRQVVIIDALPPDGAPGRIVAIRYQTEHRPARPAYSLHDLDLFWQLAAARRNGFRGEVLLLGIAAESFECRIGLSPTLRQALPALVAEVTRVMQRFWGGTSRPEMCRGCQR